MTLGDDERLDAGEEPPQKYYTYDESDEDSAGGGGSGSDDDAALLVVHGGPSAPGSHEEDSDGGASDDEAAGEAPAGVPLKPMLALGLVLLASACNVTVLFPFLPFMVKSFGITKNDTEIGYYVGLIGSAFMLGRFFSSYVWGHVADRYGRKVVFWVGLGSMVVTCVGFGMSTNIYAAISWRFVSGLFNGVVAVAKAVASELTGKGSQARGMSIIANSWGFGIVIGPAVGGLLSEPADKAGLRNVFSDGGLFGHFPYLLPMLFTAVLGLVAMVALHLYVPETRAGASEEAAAAAAAPAAVEMTRARKTKCAGGGRYAAVEAGEGGGGAGGAAGGAADEAAGESGDEAVEAATPVPLSKRHGVRVMVALYSFLSLISILVTEIYSVWATTAVEDGGLGFGTSEVGLSLMTFAVVVVALNLLFFPRVVKRYGARHVFRVASLAMAPSFFFFPHVADLFASSPAYLLWPVLVLTCTVRLLANSFSFTATFLLINNSVEAELRGRVNGLAMMVGSLFKAIGPALGGALFAWSLGNGLAYPLDYHLTYYFLGVSTVALFFCSRAIPASMDRPLGEAEADVRA